MEKKSGWDSRMVLFDIIKNNKSIDKIALRFRKESLTYRQLYSLSVRFGNYLRAFIGERRNIGIMIGNSINYSIAYFAITYANCTIVPIYSDLQLEKLAELCTFCDIALVVTENDCIPNARNISIRNINITSVINHTSDCNFIDVDYSDSICYDSDSNAILIQTSGTTTTTPKFVMLSHNQLIANASMIIDSLKISENDTTLIVLPMRYSCNTSQFLTHLMSKSTIVIENEASNVIHVVKTIIEESVTNIALMPPTLYLLSKVSNDLLIACKTLRFISYSGCQPNYSVVDQVQNKMKWIDFIETYGMTEAGPRISDIHSSEKRNHKFSVGRPMNGVQAKLVDDFNEQIRDANATGELCVKSPGVMSGYYKDREASSKALCNGWLKTGDVGRIDDDGYIYIVGRKKNLINCGGNKIYPEEIEKVILTVAGVKDVKIYGAKHSILGEVPFAELAIVDEAVFDEVKSDVYSCCRTSLEKFKIPRDIILVDQIERKNGKIKRR